MWSNTKTTALFLFLIIIIEGVGSVNGQILIKADLSPNEMVHKVLLNDTSGIKIEEVQFTGSVKSIGVFTSATKYLPIKKGLVLSTGLAENADGPNESGNMGTLSFNPGDKDLDRIADGNTADAAILELLFYPNTDEISFEYFFASEEYPEYVNHGVNDVFAFFISGAGYEQPANIAKLPTTGEPITVDNINVFKNSNYYQPNIPWIGIQNQTNVKEAELSFSFEFDGMTQMLEAKAKVVPYQPYRLKIAIADVGDNIYDSGVFIRASSLKSRGKNIPFATIIESDLKNEMLQSEFITYKIENDQIHIQSNIQFHFNSYELHNEYLEALKSLVKLLNQYFDIQLQLVGHTDNVGTTEYNIDLSVARALAIKNYLTSQNIKAQRISVEGKGNLEPLFPENTELAKAQNRRVEFILYKK
ncbi:MAG: OmpA family protein [Salinivirgaceae bacterium]